MGRIERLRELVESGVNEADQEQYQVKVWPIDLASLLDLVEAQHDALEMAAPQISRITHNMHSEALPVRWWKAHDAALAAYEKFDQGGDDEQE